MTGTAEDGSAPPAGPYQRRWMFCKIWVLSFLRCWCLLAGKYCGWCGHCVCQRRPARDRTLCQSGNLRGFSFFRLKSWKVLVSQCCSDVLRCSQPILLFVTNWLTCSEEAVVSLAVNKFRNRKSDQSVALQLSTRWLSWLSICSLMISYEAHADTSHVCVWQAVLQPLIISFHAVFKLEARGSEEGTCSVQTVDFKRPWYEQLCWWVHPDASWLFARRYPSSQHHLPVQGMLAT